MLVSHIKVSDEVRSIDRSQARRLCSTPIAGACRSLVRLVSASATACMSCDADSPCPQRDKHNVCRNAAGAAFCSWIKRPVRTQTGLAHRHRMQHATLCHAGIRTELLGTDYHQIPDGRTRECAGSVGGILSLSGAWLILLAARSTAKVMVAECCDSTNVAKGYAVAGEAPQWCLDCALG